jgi:hypothetical protein
LKAPHERQRWCEKIWTMIDRAESDGDLTEEEMLLDEEFRDEVVEEVMQGVAIELMENKLEESIPVLSEAVGVVLDNAFIHKIEKSARCIFQELWLRENQKVGEIAPVETTIDLTAAVGQGLGRAVYFGAFGVGFGVTLPSLLISRAGASVLPEPVLEALRTGASDADERVNQVLVEGKNPLSASSGGSAASAEIQPAG